MPVAYQELEIAARERVGCYGRGEGRVVLRVDAGLDGARGAEVVVDVLDAGFVEGEVGLAGGEVEGGEGLVGGARGEVEGRGVG